ncbi:hypothetical protein [Knoellia koreensis]|uniref:Uncharacterized protein n=1 Tax=Knoellia koreensis TaxID=2730921 RepID=A0A849H9V7_9MICO|nr:hypothetical protein [Knoellia sp. DB2414S]NNM46516.1 hypothetical protein [Knoellia sp. DB2414S]
MSRLSRTPAERDLQVFAVVCVGVLVVAVLAVFALQLPSLANDPGDRPSGRSLLAWPSIVAGAALLAVSLRLPVLVARHRSDIATTPGLKSQYVTGALLPLVFGVFVPLFWWLGPAASLVGLVALVLVLRVRQVSRRASTDGLDIHSPKAWGSAATGSGLTFGRALLVGLILGIVIIGAVFAWAALGS